MIEKWDRPISDPTTDIVTRLETGDLSDRFRFDCKYLIISLRRQLVEARDAGREDVLSLLTPPLANELREELKAQGEVHGR